MTTLETFYFWKNKQVMVRHFSDEVMWAFSSPEYRRLVDEFRNMPCWFDGLFWRFNFLGAHGIKQRIPKAFKLELLIMGVQL